MLLTESAPTPPPQQPSTPGAHVSVPRTLLIAIVVAMIAAAFGTGCSPAASEAAGQQQRSQTRARRVEVNEKDGTTNREMPNTNSEMEENNARSPFYMALKKALKERKLKLENVCDAEDAVSRRVLEDYGAIFLASPDVLPPPVCMFTSEADVLKFQDEAGASSAIIGGARIELQPAAMNALLAAREEARQMRLDITPRGGSEAARRGYDDTERLWNTRFLPALTYWNKRGRLSKEQVTHLRNLPLHDQVREVLELEKEGIYFSKDFSKSILYSIAAPGTSQHIAMLALDVDQFADERVRRILARHGWFQTVKSDLPHFTYLGLEEKDLPARGLRSVVAGNQLFWIPNVSGE